MSSLLKTAAFCLLCACPWAIASETAPKPPGRLVDLGGHRLHVRCTGSGSPTVVVETGLGDFSFDWILVQQKVERFARICTYDRGGYAWSDPGPMPRSFPQLNLELHDALKQLGERGPFVLVGHSFGGGVVRSYARIYPDEVAGLVLADAVQEDQRIPMGPKAARIRDFAQHKAIPAARESMQLSDKLAPPPPSGPEPLDPALKRLPAREQALHVWAQALPQLENAENSQREWSAEALAAMHETEQKGILHDLPLIVLTRAEGGYANDLDVSAAELEAERKGTQQSLVLLSSRGKQILLHCGHNMHLEAPDEVAAAIREITESARARAANQGR